MIPASYIFYLFAGITVVSAVWILFTKKVMYAAYLLIVTFFGVAALYVFAGAELVAITQILVYAGGIMVLIIFGIMLTNRISGQPIITETHNQLGGILAGGVLFYLLFRFFISMNWGIAEQGITSDGYPVIRKIGILLMTDYILPFEVVALLLLVALMGAAVIARKKEEAE